MGKLRIQSGFARATESSPLWRRIRRVEHQVVLDVYRFAIDRFGSEVVNEPVQRIEEIERAATGGLEPLSGEWEVFQHFLRLAPVPVKDAPGKRSLARLYLEARGSALPEPERVMLEGVARCPFSFFQVRASVPGQSIRLRDVMLGTEMEVKEESASRQVIPGLLVFGRVIPAGGGDHLMMRTACEVFPPDWLERLVHWRKDMGPLGPETLAALWDDILGLYFELRHELLHPAPPVLKNTHGEDYELQTLHYSLELPLAEAVKALASLGQESPEDLLAEAKRDKRSALKQVEVIWTGPDKAGVFGGHPVTLGTLIVTPSKLRIEVNSAKRAARIRARVAKLLGKNAVFRSAEIQGAADLLKKAGWTKESLDVSLDTAAASQTVAVPADALEPGQDPMELPEVKAQVQAMGARRWQSWLDAPLPALDGASPRKAAKTAAGRELLEAVLFDFESRRASNNLMAPDVPALKRALGMG